MAYVAIAVEGGLFPPDLLDDIANGKGAGQDPAAFGIDPARLPDEMQAAFSDVRSTWDAFRRRLVFSKESRTSLTRSAWMLPFFERLGFDQVIYTPAAVQAGGESFAISHRAGDDPAAPPVQIGSIDEPLGKKSGNARRSPHALVQEYLNRSDALWGMVANGENVRLLRDSARFSKPTYLEFDLGAMIEGNLYSEFVILFRLLHRTRFPDGATDTATCILEKLYQSGLETGGRVRDHLRDGVEKAIDELGAAFLRHPGSDKLREAMAGPDPRLSSVDYYRQLLRLIYRLLFLFVAEERRLIFPEGSADEATLSLRRVYDAYYSVTRLRNRCDRPFADDRYSDAWVGLLETFRLFRDEGEAAKLGLTALAGELFGGSACRDLEGAGCENAAFLRALRHLSTFKDGDVWRRVNYAALDVEELGSVYESLLDLQPSVDPADPKTPFKLISGTERKTTGSYYTPSSLVFELIESALVPVVRERLAAAKTTADREAALLGIRVCDPAAGSGHFLLAAARRLGRELATVRTGELSPAPEAYREAVRDVIRTCVYAVDKNPLAADLCKVALWIEGHHAGLPLSFLDHHVKAGDSLVGVFDLAVLKRGIPDEAYAPVSGDDKRLAAELKALNRRTRDRSTQGFQQPSLLNTTMPDGADAMRRFAEKSASLAVIVENSPQAVREKERAYVAFRGDALWRRFRDAANLWTAAFFLPMDASVKSGTDPLFPTTEKINAVLTEKPLNALLNGRVDAAADRLGFFHWPLEFPEVFEDGGFDVILANPPWERVKLQEQEFFAASDFAIANAPNKAARQKLIDTLGSRNPDLLKQFDTARHDAEATSKTLRGSGRYPLTGRGDVNTYSVFAELMTELIGPRGRMGVIVPTGIATDDTNKLFFGNLVETGKLRALYDFENREKIFAAVDSRMKFSMLCVGAAQAERRFEVAFFLTQPAQLREPDRVYPMTAEEIELLNPNTKTCPIFRSARDAEITKRIYRRVPVLVNEAHGVPPVDSWP